MSCDYDVICTQCNERLGLSDWNHCDVECRSFVANADRLADIAERMSGLDLELRHYRGDVDWKWFIAHRGHPMRVIDEYGRLDDSCDVRTTCEHCGHGFSCRGVEGHEGQHRVARKEAGR